MPVPRPKHGEITDLSKHRQKKSTRTPSARPDPRPELADLPAVVVRRLDDPAPVELINLPMRDDGADMVLQLIRDHPDACAVDRDGRMFPFREIAQVICPVRGEMEIERAKTGPPASGAYRTIRVRLGTRNDETVGIFNIPDTESGRKLLHAILVDYRRTTSGIEYTLFTTDYGYLPVRELADANLPKP